MQKSITFLAVFMLLISSTSLSQTLSPTVITGGGGYMQNNVSLSWSLGEPLTQTFVSDSTTLTQGFHQPLVEVASIAPNLSEQKQFIAVHPNPVKHNLHLAAKQRINGEIQLKLFSITGRLLWERMISGRTLPLEISLTDYRAGTYLLKTFYSNQTQSFKIIKK